MAKSSAYSMINVQATLDGLAIQGLWDGDDAVVVTHGADVGALLVGADGASIFSQSADRSAQISIKLMHTSPTHRQLIQKWKAQRAGRLIGFPFDVIEKTSGKGGTTDQCFIMQAPANSDGKNAVAHEWVLVTGDWEPNVTNP